MGRVLRTATVITNGPHTYWELLDSDLTLALWVETGLAYYVIQGNDSINDRMLYAIRNYS